MKRRIALCIVAVAGLFPACARAIEAADDAGPVYVSEKDGAACLELGPAGVFYLRSAPGEYSGGTWESRRKVVTMLPHAGSQVTMTRDGEALVDAAGTRWLKDTHAAAPKNDTARPVYVTVRDFDTGRAVTEFSYDYWIDTEAGRETTRWARRRNVRAADGSVTIDAPPDCDVTVCVESPDYISGFGNWGIFTVESTDDSRSFVIELRRGAVVRGTVTDGADGKPLENSRVSAIVSPTIGVSGPDLVRGVLTDGKGEFVLRGVDPELGINVHHPAYVEFDGMRITDHAGRTERQEVSVKVALEKGARINGTVLDAGQDPIEGVMVGGVGMKSVMTGRDGSFSIVSPDKPGVGGVISFTKAGYRGRRLPVPLDTPVVILENEVRTELGGKVTGPDGAPVGRFEIVLGPGNDPEVWQCKRTEIINSNGVFRLDTPFNDRNWVAIRADGFAPWDSGIEPGRDAGGRTISLSKGVAVRGRIVLRGGPALAGAELVLIPSRWMIKAGIRSLSIGEAFLAHETTGRPDGSFLIENVNPGEYVLSVTSDTASPCEYWLSVPKDGIEVGTITLDGLGKIRGRAFRAGGGDGLAAVQNEYGEIRWMSDPVGDVIRTFATDDDGAFVVSNVPVGVVTIGVGESLAANPEAAGFRSTHTARVCAGLETEVCFNESNSSAGLCVEIVVGDGSSAQCRSAAGLPAATGTIEAEGADSLEIPGLQVRLVAPPDVPVRIHEPLDLTVGVWGNLVDVNGMPPGRYRLEVGGQLGAGMDNVLYSGNVEIQAGARPAKPPVCVVLGAGSIVCRLAAPAGDLANTVIAAVERSGAMPPQYGACDDDGRFSLCFLRPGTYTAWIHSPPLGWARLDGLIVSNNVCDAGEVVLTGGATLKGRLFAPFEKRYDSYEVSASSSGGARIIAGTSVDGRNGETYSFDNLWPDEWTVSLSGDGTVLRSQRVWVDGRNAAEADLAGKRAGLANVAP